VFAKNVRKFRQADGLSQEELAEKCGMHRTYISAVERCKRSISLDNIQRIADALEVETYKLFLPEEKQV
jgi:Predicted transcriptional regulator with C-terminal CBS domains